MEWKKGFGLCWYFSHSSFFRFIEKHFSMMIGRIICPRKNLKYKNKQTTTRVRMQNILFPIEFCSGSEYLWESLAHRLTSVGYSFVEWHFNLFRFLFYPITNWKRRSLANNDKVSSFLCPQFWQICRRCFGPKFCYSMLCLYFWIDSGSFSSCYFH